MRGAAASPADKSDCLDSSKDSITRTSACTRVIEDSTASANERASGFVGRASVYYFDNDYDKSISDYTEAIRLVPDDARSYNNRGRAYYQKRDYGRAIADYSQAIRLNPGNASALNNRGVAYSKKGDFNLAIADFNEAIRLAPGYVNAFYNRGITFADQGHYSEAIEDLKKAVGLEPNNSDLYNELAWTYFKMGNGAVGLPFVEHSLGLNPNNAKAHDTKGAIYEALGRKLEALAEFRQALLLDPALQSSVDALRRLAPQATPLLILELASLAEQHGWIADMDRLCSTFKMGRSSNCKFKQLAISDGEPGTLNNYGINVPLDKTAEYVLMFHLTPLVGSFFMVSTKGELISSFYRRQGSDYLAIPIADARDAFSMTLKFWESNLDKLKKLIAAKNIPQPR